MDPDMDPFNVEVDSNIEDFITQVKRCKGGGIEIYGKGGGFSTAQLAKRSLSQMS